jgi:hypothetical protein
MRSKLPLLLLPLALAACNSDRSTKLDLNDQTAHMKGPGTAYGGAAFNSDAWLFNQVGGGSSIIQMDPSGADFGSGGMPLQAAGVRLPVLVDGQPILYDEVRTHIDEDGTEHTTTRTVPLVAILWMGGNKDVNLGVLSYNSITGEHRVEDLTSLGSPVLVAFEKLVPGFTTAYEAASDDQKEEFMHAVTEYVKLGQSLFEAMEKALPILTGP